MNIPFDPTKTAQVELAEGKVNIADEQILAQVASNIRRGLPQAMPYQPNSETAILVAGGPSLEMTKRELVELYWRGGKVITMNGSYDWCIANNIRPSATVLMDGREFNARFVEQPVVNCTYFLSSQCHPAAFELCRDRRVTIWHSLSAGLRELKLLNEYYFDDYPLQENAPPDNKPHRCFPVCLGTTVALRAISLLRMLGYTNFEIFGLDSCYLDDRHHGYDQPENDDEVLIPVWLRPQGRDDLAKRFICSVWQAKQFEDFQALLKDRGELFQLQVHGPGLIATALTLGAEVDAGGVIQIGD